MSFLDILKSRKLDESTVSADIAAVDTKLDLVKRDKNLTEDSLTNTIVKLFNNNNMKIRMINPTPFGLQIEFFKKPNLAKVNEILSELDKKPKIRLKNNSIFIELWLNFNFNCDSMCFFYETHF